MATPQAGIFALGTRTHHHLEYDVHAEVDDGAIVAALTRLGEPHVTGGGRVHDRLLDFTRAVTGSYYFAPSIEDLAGVGA